MLSLAAASVLAYKTEQLTVPRGNACRPWSKDMCPSEGERFKDISEKMSYIGLFLSPAGKWACEHNDFCGVDYWKRGGACEQMDCAARAAEDREGFCAKRMNGCAKTCGCSLGSNASNVEVLVPDGHGDGKAAPLVLWLHGYTGAANWMSSMWKLEKIVDDEKGGGGGVIVAAPNGGVDDMGYPYWDAGSAFHGRFADELHDSQQARRQGATSREPSQGRGREATWETR